MSAAQLLSQAEAHVRAAFSRQEVADVRQYGGEFNAAEIEHLSYNCPAILITTLGWLPEPVGGRLSGKRVRRLSIAAFVATKHAKREARMAQAMNIAERLALLMRDWVPTDTDTFAFAPADEEPSAENLFSRAVDKHGQALWLVRWTQCAAPQPTVDPAQLFDLLRVDITDHTQPGTVPPAPAPGPGGLLVTEDLQFAATPFPPTP